MRSLVLLLILLFSACALTAPLPTPIDLRPVIERAVLYLESEYDAEIGLIRESPITAPDRYWLATDNQLAVYALDALDSPLAATLTEILARYPDRSHGLIEALVGEPVEWPPRVETQRQVDGQIWHEDRLSGAHYGDWAEYADLALYGALIAYHQGDADEASARYQLALCMFDGVGFADKAYTSPDGHGLYATYKLALALYVADAIGEPLDMTLLDALLSKRTPSGGFTTLYNNAGAPQGDTNTETTSYALLALKGVSHAQNHPSTDHFSLVHRVRTAHVPCPAATTASPTHADAVAL